MCLPSVQYEYVSCQNLSSNTTRKFVIVTLIVGRAVPVKKEASFIFTILSQSILVEFKVKTLIISIKKEQTTDTTREILVGLKCENASKHTFRTKLIETFSEATISKIEAKKGVGPWSFDLVGKDKEPLLCFGEDIFYLKGVAGAFHQHSAVPPLLAASTKKEACASKASKKRRTSKKNKKEETPLNKERAPYLVVRLLKGPYAFLFSYCPRFWRRRLMNFIAFFWGVLLLALLLTIIYFLLDYALEGFELDLEISPERAKRYNDLLEKSLRFPRIFKEPTPPPAVPWYYPSELYSYGKGVFCRAADWICVDSMKCGLSYLRKCLLEHFYKPR